MKLMFEKFASKHKDKLYLVFRVLVGLMFMQHGAQKLFGYLGGPQAELMSLFGLAGIFEFFGGLALALGLFTRVVAIITSLEMLYAFFMVHAKGGEFIPILNKGELALMYFAAFLVLIAFGGGKWSFDENKKS